MTILKKSSEIAKIRGEKTLESVIKKLAVNDERIAKGMEAALAQMTIVASSLKDANSDVQDKLHQALMSLTRLKEAELARKKETASIVDVMTALDDAINKGGLASTMSDIEKNQKENHNANWKFEIERDSKGFAKMIIGSKV